MARWHSVEKIGGTSITATETVFDNVLIAGREGGLVVQAMTALADAGITVLGLQHQIRHVDIQFLIETREFDHAVRVLHHALIAREGACLGARKAA